MTRSPENPFAAPGTPLDATGTMAEPEFVVKRLGNANEPWRMTFLADERLRIEGVEELILERKDLAGPRAYLTAGFDRPLIEMRSGTPYRFMLPPDSVETLRAWIAPDYDRILAWSLRRLASGVAVFGMVILLSTVSRYLVFARLSS